MRTGVHHLTQGTLLNGRGHEVVASVHHAHERLGKGDSRARQQGLVHVRETRREFGPGEPGSIGHFERPRVGVILRLAS